jgi:nicotinate-nucleotide adenylyltransferase
VLNSLLKFRNTKLKIGILGGSFNPAHAGHLYISNKACKVLKLDYVWWLVSPGNPLKKQSEMMEFDYRFKSSQAIAKGNIIVSDIERIIKTRYTIDIIKRIKLLFPFVEFYWIMGADNLVNFHLWKKWQQIFALTKIIVYDRAPYTFKALNSIAALKYNYAKRDSVDLITQQTLPAWCFLRLKKHPLSATQIRETLKNQKI